jgi:hypothetical protein
MISGWPIEKAVGISVKKKCVTRQDQGETSNQNVAGHTQIK